FANDTGRLARFQREAQLLAALAHPRIAGIHGIEEGAGGRFLVLELVEGESLAQHIARGPLPIAEALAIARQIVDALEAAHDKGSDVGAFGCVLFEMLTGRRAFQGDDVSDTLAAILRGEPDWNALPAGVPPHVRATIQRSLAKDRKARIPDFAVVRFLFDEPA